MDISVNSTFYDRQYTKVTYKDMTWYMSEEDFYKFVQARKKNNEKPKEEFIKSDTDVLPFDRLR